MSALYDAAVAGDTATVKRLLESGADPDEATEEGTPLCAAACWGHTETVKALLGYDADPDRREQDDYTPLKWALEFGHAETAHALLEAGATPEPLSAAVAYGSPQIVQDLLDYGATPTQEDIELAEDWAETDVEAELKDQLDGEVRRTPLADGLERIEIVAEEGTLTRETGHAQILQLLRGGSQDASTR